MTESLTDAIRRAVAELVDAAPLPPDLPAHPRSLRRSVALVGAVVVALAIAGLAVRQNNPRSTTVAVGPVGSVPEAVGVAPAITLNPTFVSPERPPAGFRFIEGGSRGSMAHGSGDAILVVGPDGRQARLYWNVITMRGGCDVAQPVTTLRGAPGTSDAPTTTTTPAPTPAAAPFKTYTGGVGELRWCDDAVLTTLSTTGFDEGAARALAVTVRRVPGKGSNSLSPPRRASPLVGPAPTDRPTPLRSGPRPRWRLDRNSSSSSVERGRPISGCSKRKAPRRR